ncbi:MAG: hypothetical protein Ta2B_28620 [Termitinemataceae bacterium]|nr:MAG: hypothetical protein Ta2B_28620 [Termitinemataceae bacterium]
MSLQKLPSILAIDCATEILSIGLSTSCADEKNLHASVAGEPQKYFFEADAGQRHSELLIDATANLINIAGIKKSDIDIFACMEGPGSFTGLRIGFSAVKGFALALGKKIVPVPTLDCIALPFNGFNGLVIPAIDAKQKHFFASLFYKGERLCAYLDISAQNLSELIIEHNVNNTVILCGNGACLLETAIKPLLSEFNIFTDPAFRSGRASLMLKYIEKKYIMNCSDLKSFEGSTCCAPIYVRAPIKTHAP